MWSKRADQTLPTDHSSWESLRFGMVSLEFTGGREFFYFISSMDGLDTRLWVSAGNLRRYVEVEGGPLGHGLNLILIKILIWGFIEVVVGHPECVTTRVMRKREREACVIWLPRSSWQMDITGERSWPSLMRWDGMDTRQRTSDNFHGNYSVSLLMSLVQEEYSDHKVIASPLPLPLGCYDYCPLITLFNVL